MIATPRTNKIAENFEHLPQMAHSAIWPHARELERELVIESNRNDNMAFEIGKAAVEIGLLTEQRDRLAEALKWYANRRNYKGPNQRVELPEDVDRGGGYRLDVQFDGGKIAREALAAVEGGGR